MLDTVSKESNFIRHEPCPACGSKDNLAVYDDHKFCFGCGHYESTKESNVVNIDKGKKNNLIRGEAKALSKRKINEETCNKYSYQVGDFNGQPVQIANYLKSGKIVGQKLRFANKDFVWIPYLLLTILVASVSDL